MSLIVLLAAVCVAVVQSEIFPADKQCKTDEDLPKCREACEKMSDEKKLTIIADLCLENKCSCDLQDVRVEDVTGLTKEEMEKEAKEEKDNEKKDKEKKE